MGLSLNSGTDCNALLSFFTASIQSSAVLMPSGTYRSTLPNSLTLAKPVSVRLIHRRFPYGREHSISPADFADAVFRQERHQERRHPVEDFTCQLVGESARGYREEFHTEGTEIHERRVSHGGHGGIFTFMSLFVVYMKLVSYICS